MIFSGIMYDLTQVTGVRAFLSYISIIRFSIGAMTVNEFAPDPARYTASEWRGEPGLPVMAGTSPCARMHMHFPPVRPSHTRGF